MVLLTRKVPLQDQHGVLAVYDWLIEGEVVRSVGLPYKWPSPVLLSKSSPRAVRQSDSLIIRFESEAAPATIQIRGYDTLRTDTVPQGEPDLVKIWENPRIFKSHPEIHARELALREIDGRKGWEFDVESAPSITTLYIVVWATWADFIEDSAGPYSANWLFAVQREGACLYLVILRHRYSVSLP